MRSGESWLHKQAEWTGHWWLPGDTENYRPGVLHYNPEEGLSLALIGGFEERTFHQVEPGTWDAVEGEPWKVILGIADNQEVTLLDCLPTSSKYYRMPVGPPHKQSINAQTALVGVHLTSENDRVFTACRMSLEGLTIWSADSAFSTEIGFTDDDKLDGRGTIEASTVDGHKARHGTTTLRLEHHHTLPRISNQRGRTLGRMTDSAVLYVEPDEPNSLADFRQTGHALQDLISLATHRAAGILWFTLRMPPEERERPEGSPMLPREVSVYAVQRVVGDPDANAPERGILFTTEHLPFEKVVPRWLEIRDRFAATVNLILGLRYVPGGYLETQLSQAVTAAEALHRALNLDPPIPPEEFKALKRTVLDAVPKDRRDWVGGLLARNEPSLKKRLLDLASRPDDEAMANLLPDPQRWAKMTVEARNKLTHTGQSSAYNLEGLFAVARVTTAVVLLNLLHELGLSADKQRAILLNNTELTTACRLSRERCSDS